MGKGIDYGMGQTNIDPANGIRFGVIPMNDLSEWAWDSFEGDCGDNACPKCGGAVIEYDGEQDNGEEGPDGAAPYAPYHRGSCSDYMCESCRVVLGSDEVTGDEPIGHVLDDGEYKATADRDGDVFILASPYFTRARFCSPCAPGACYLTSPDADGERAYCFGHDWFEGDKAPYPVYSVATGGLVPAPDGSEGSADDESEEEEGPADGDYVTRDRITWREHGTGKFLLRTSCPTDAFVSADDYGAQLKAHMTAAGFYPNAWLERERGGWDLLDLDTGSFAEYSR